jgi:hypothetical protein
LASTGPNSPISALIAFLTINSSSMYFTDLILAPPFQRMQQGCHTISWCFALNTS